MIPRIFHISKVVISSTRHNFTSNNVTTVNLLLPRNPLVQNTRSTTSFFMKRKAEELWKSVVSVSNAGKRRGRGRGTPRTIDFSKGKQIGIGKVRMLFPGLNTDVLDRNMQREIRKLDTEEPVQDITRIMRKRSRSVHPLLRGFTGSSAAGRKYGPPDPINGEEFNNFESWILKCKTNSVITSNMGRCKVIRTLVITGNGDGLVGFATSEGTEFRSSITAAKNRAGQRLMYIPRYEDHTVMHDFFTQFWKTKIYVEKRHKGYGLKCHRVIRVCCEAIGIKDIYAKIEGSTNVPYIVKAFLIGLLQQKSYQQLADEKKLHVVEMRPECSNFPKVLASPAVVRKEEDIKPDEILDYNQYLLGGRIFLKKKPYPPFYTRLPSWQNHLRKVERHRDQLDVAIKAKAEYGYVCSFLTEKYPEARTIQRGEVRKAKEAAEKAGEEATIEA